MMMGKMGGWGRMGLESGWFAEAARQDPEGTGAPWSLTPGGGGERTAQVETRYHFDCRANHRHRIFQKSWMSPHRVHPLGDVIGQTSRESIHALRPDERPAPGVLSHKAASTSSRFELWMRLKARKPPVHWITLWGLLLSSNMLHLNRSPIPDLDLNLLLF
jgi:hypothetical protein